VEAAYDPADPLAETPRLHLLADTPGNSGMPQGIVAYADLSAHDVGVCLRLTPSTPACAVSGRS